VFTTKAEADLPSLLFLPFSHTGEGGINKSVVHNSVFTIDCILYWDIKIYFTGGESYRSARGISKIPHFSSM
jgi:hypothetical protein